MAKKPIIAVDVDDVLAASAAGWVAYSNKHWNSNLSIDDYDEDWAKMWQVDHEVGLERAYQIHNDSSIIAAFKHDQQAKAVLRQLGERFELVIATSRVVKHLDETLNWLDQHFKGVFSSVNLAGIFDEVTKESFNATKADLVGRLGADYLIDDQLKHCIAVAKSGKQAILFGDYGWNQTDVLPDGVTRCKDWTAVAEYFNGQQA